MRVVAVGSSSGWLLVEEASRQGLIDPAVVDLARNSPDVTLVMMLEAVGGEAVRYGDDRMAERLYRAALKEGSRLPGVPYNLGNIATRAGRRHEAIKFYSQAIDFDPSMGSAYYNRGLQRRQLGDEAGARRDIAMGIERGYDGLPAYAALVRGRMGDYGDSVSAFEQAVLVRQVLAGDQDMAVLLAGQEVRKWGGTGRKDIRSRLALVVALENERYVREQVGDTAGAVAAGSELIALCKDLADRGSSAWYCVPKELREFTVGQLPRRLIDMIGLYARAGQHDDALLAAEQAQARCGGLQTLDPRLDKLYDELSRAVYRELKRRALAASGEGER